MVEQLIETSLFILSLDTWHLFLAAGRKRRGERHELELFVSVVT
jgi:hypothetical protein